MLDVVAGGRGYWHEGFPVSLSTEAIDDWQQLRLLDQVDLVENQHHLGLCVLDQIQQVPQSRAGTFRDVDDQPDDVHLANRVDRRLDHPHVEPVEWPMDAW